MLFFSYNSLQNLDSNTQSSGHCVCEFHDLSVSVQNWLSVMAVQNSTGKSAMPQLVVKIVGGKQIKNLIHATR